MNRINSLPNLTTPSRLPKALTPSTPGEMLNFVAGLKAGRDFQPDTAPAGTARVAEATDAFLADTSKRYHAMAYAFNREPGTLDLAFAETDALRELIESDPDRATAYLDTLSSMYHHQLEEMVRVVINGVTDMVEDPGGPRSLRFENSWTRMSDVWHLPPVSRATHDDPQHP